MQRILEAIISLVDKRRTTMIRLILLFLFLLNFINSGAEKVIPIGNLTLVSGHTLYDCRIGFSIIGEKNCSPENTILYPTWFGGTSTEIASLIRKYSLFDTTGLCIIAVDALGNGISSSPTNTIGIFPEISIRDMVLAEHKLLKEYFGLDSIFAIIGGSMGGMQVFEWAATFPNFMKKCIPYVSTPSPSYSDRLLFAMQIELIDLALEHPENAQNIFRISSGITTYTARTTDKLNSLQRDQDFENIWQKMYPEFETEGIFKNRRVQYNAMRHYDLDKIFGDKKLRLPEFLIIVSEDDRILNPGPAKQFAEINNSELLSLTTGCGHLAVTCDIEAVRNKLNQFLRKDFIK